jgi:2'-hydroxyisoflavone reductase
MVREALRRGHSVTLFNRGRTNDTLFPDLETIKGDRNNGLDGLEGRRWDAVIDNSGYVPRHVQDSARLLAPNCDRYIFISTVSVYEDISGATDEDSPLAALADETVEEITGATYGPLKALCEKRAAAEFDAERLAILRPTYICGPGDHTDRFSYWPIRTRKGGEMLWPGTPDDVLQIVDVRDLARFTIDCVDRAIGGTFNMVNEPHAYTMGKLLEDCRAVTAADVDPVWVTEDFARAQGLNPGAQLPIWQGSSDAFGVSAARAVAAGMQMRPERETARDLLAWWDTLPEKRRANLKAGPSADKEADVLAAWKARQRAGVSS